MSDPVTAPASDTVPRCPWCSAALPSSDVERCPSCGAALASTGGAEPVLPGITTVDTAAILRSRSEIPRQRNRLFSFLSGEVPVEDTEASEGSLAPPAADVRREMLRLELEAEKTRLEAEQSANQAEVVSLAAEAIASGKLVLTPNAQASVDAALAATTAPAQASPGDAAPALAAPVPATPGEAPPSEAATAESASREAEPPPAS